MLQFSVFQPSSNDPPQSFDFNEDPFQNDENDVEMREPQGDKVLGRMYKNEYVCQKKLQAIIY